MMAAEGIMSLPNCPKCDAEYTYEDGALLVCPMCAHEWTAAETDVAQSEDQDVLKPLISQASITLFVQRLTCCYY